MLVVTSRKTNKKHRIYHRCGCIHAQRIKLENREEMSCEIAEQNHYYACKYCSGLRGDVKVHKAVFERWTRKNHVNFRYNNELNTLYIWTEIGFWKVFEKEELGEYVLYHRNAYSAEINYREAIDGAFHRQSDVKATESMEKIVDYIVAHDRAKITIMDDYRKLPRRTKKQRKYYRAAKRREKKNAIRRLDSLFASIEQSNTGMKQYSIC